MKKHVVVLVVLSMLVSVLGGCKSTLTPAVSQSSSTSEASTDDFSETSTLNLDWGAGIGTDSVFECPWQDVQSFYPVMVFDSLMKLETDGVTVLPSLATAWEISADGLTYTLTLNENVKWHDGQAFSAEDVMFSFNTLLKVPESAAKSLFTSVAGVQDVIDGKADTASGFKANGNVVTITLTAPDNSMMKTLIGVRILPSHLLKDVDPTLFTKNEEYWKKPIGTGAYKINEVSFPNYFTLVRNDEYFGNKANIKTVLFTSHATGGAESLRADILAGKIDFAFGNAVNDIVNAKNIIEQNIDVKMEIIPSIYQRQFWFNNVGSDDGKYNTDMQKPEVRQAINLLLDKEALASFYKGQAVPLTTHVNPEFNAYNSDIPLFQRDVAKAKQMLTAAGFDFTRTVRILYYYDDQTTIDFMEVIKQNFADAGITAEPFLATGDLEAVIYHAKNWDIMYCGGTGSDPILIYQILIPDSGLMDGLFGDVEYRQATFGPLISEYKASTDAVEAKKIGDEIQLEGSKYSITLPIYGMNKVVLYNKAKLKLDESIFNEDVMMTYDLKFDKWELLK